MPLLRVVAFFLCFCASSCNVAVEPASPSLSYDSTFSSYAPPAALRPYFDDLNDFIMTLDVGSNNLSSWIDPKGLHVSIFINGNFARSLLASYRITNNKTHLEEGLRWCVYISMLCLLTLPLA